ncbi:MAG: lamin tail domain-containing protein, partial [Candidatus Delongbacteria bacterium]|nr:lamin tail domain-containing protein [Candidatus Delongbacteria bacterium]
MALKLQFLSLFFFKLRLMTLSSYTSDIIIFLIGCLIFLFFLPYFVKAQIVINEVYPQPLSSENEWIEIYYPNYCSSQQSCNQTTISLDQWTLWDQLSTPSKIYTFLSHEEISLGQYLIINSNQKLNNSADGVMLKNSSGEIIDQMNYQNSQSACSFARYPNGLGDFFCSLPSQGQSNLAFLCSGEIINLSPNPSISLSPMPSLNISSLPLTITQTPFPSPNLTISPTPTSINYQLSPQLSEIMACPTEGSEWVEFYNPYNQTIKLEAWTLWDNQKKIY